MDGLAATRFDIDKQGISLTLPPSLPPVLPYLGVPCQGGDALAYLHIPQLDRVVEGGTAGGKEGRKGGREGGLEQRRCEKRMNSTEPTSPFLLPSLPPSLPSYLANNFLLPGFSLPGPVGAHRMV